MDQDAHGSSHAVPHHRAPRSPHPPDKRAGGHLTTPPHCQGVPTELPRIDNPRAEHLRSWLEAFHGQATATAIARVLRYASRQVPVNSSASIALVRDALSATLARTARWDPLVTSLQAHLVGWIRSRVEHERSRRPRNRPSIRLQAVTFSSNDCDPATDKILSVLRAHLADQEINELQQDSADHERAIDAMYDDNPSPEEPQAVRSLLQWVRSQIDPDA